MATVIRIKRRLDEEPTENIVIKAKRSRKEKADEEDDYLPVGESSTVLMRVGTLESKEEAIEPLVLKAIKKGWELRESYKKLGGSGTTYKTKTTQEARQRAISKRYKIISQSRGIELPPLDKKGACIGTEESQLIKDKKDEVAGAEALPDTSMELSCFDAVLANEKEDVITCNGVPLESEKYVYDVFYSTQPVNWEEVMEENLCRIERQVFETLSGSDSDERYDDEDDENEEGNWRNDYPDYDDSPCEDEEDYLNSQIRKAKNLKNFQTDESYDEEDYEDEGFDIDGKLIERYSLSKLVRSMKVGESSSSTSDSEDE